MVVQWPPFTCVQEYILYNSCRTRTQLNSYTQHCYSTVVFTPCKEWSSNHRSQTAADGTQCLTIAIDSASRLNQGGVTDEHHHTRECHHSEVNSRTCRVTWLGDGHLWKYFECGPLYKYVNTGVTIANIALSLHYITQVSLYT